MWSNCLFIVINSSGLRNLNDDNHTPCYSIQLIEPQRPGISMHREKTYTEHHDWIETNGDIATIGISQSACDELGEIVYIELPQPGEKVAQGDVAVVLESTKAAIDVYAPIGGEIVAANEKLKENPDLINQSPEEEGWLYQLKT